MARIEQLLENEEILWKGKPKAGFQFVIGDLLVIPVLLSILAIGTLFYIYGRSDAMHMVVGCAITFIYGVYMRYIKDIYDRRDKRYYITAKNVIISLNAYENIIIPFEEIWEFSLVEHPFDYKYGSIFFEEEESVMGKVGVWSRGGVHLQREKVSIAFIKDYKEPYDLIKSKVNELKNVNTK